MPETHSSSDDSKAVETLQRRHAEILGELGKVIHGQREVIDLLLTCVFSGGHALLMGVPGLAKTLLIQTLSKVLDLSFSRIQFTPDLMPSDITGTEILQETGQPGRRAFEFVKGPVFTNMLLADEINRTPPKTQAALLQAMQEKEITVTGKHYVLDKPFFVLATQNPIEQEGTYPLPEAQLDRFMFFISIGYPTFEDELAIANGTSVDTPPELKVVLSKEDILDSQRLIRKIPVSRHILEACVRLVRSTRPADPDSPGWIKDLIVWGAGPRAIQHLLIAAKARAALQGSFMVRFEDVIAIAPSVLRHRLHLSFHAESQGFQGHDIVARLLAEAQVI